MGLILLSLTLQLSPVDSLAERLDPEHVTAAAIESLEERTSWLLLAQEGAHRGRLALDLPRTRLAIAGRGMDDGAWSGYVRTTLPGSIALTAGDLRPSFGSGMILATPRFGTPETSGISNALRSPRLTGYAGTNTERQIRGVALARDTRSLFAGVFTAGQTRGAALEHRRGTMALGALAVRTSPRRTKTEVWFRTGAGSAAFELGASGRSVMGAVRLTRGRGKPAFRIAARRLSALGGHAAPPRLRSGQGKAEHGLTMAARWPAGGATVMLSVDHSTGGDDTQDRARLAFTSPTTELRIDRRLRTDRLPAAPLATAASHEWRIQASHRIPGPPTIILSGFVATKQEVGSSYLRVRIQWARGRRWQFEAGLVEFRTQPGGPVSAVYEPSPEGAFPIVRLSGRGRRVSMRITRSGRRVRGRVACYWHSAGAMDDLGSPAIATKCSLSLSG